MSSLGFLLPELFPPRDWEPMRVRLSLCTGCSLFLECSSSSSWLIPNWSFRCQLRHLFPHKTLSAHPHPWSLGSPRPRRFLHHSSNLSGLSLSINVFVSPIRFYAQSHRVLLELSWSLLCPRSKYNNVWHMNDWKKCFYWNTLKTTIAITLIPFTEIYYVPGMLNTCSHLIPTILWGEYYFIIPTQGKGKLNLRERKPLAQIHKASKKWNPNVKAGSWVQSLSF